VSDPASVESLSRRHEPCGDSRLGCPGRAKLAGLLPNCPALTRKYYKFNSAQVLKGHGFKLRRKRRKKNKSGF
jgi:hypothetical protein